MMFCYTCALYACGAGRCQFHIVHCSTGEKTLNELKDRWITAGRPELPDWKALFEGL